MTSIDSAAESAPQLRHEFSSWWTRWAWLPIPVLLTLMLVLRVAGPRTPYESPAALLGLNFIFLTLTLLIVTFLAGRAFLAGGPAGLLLLGCGALILAMGATAGVLAGMAKSPSGMDANMVVTVYTRCSLMAAVCHLAGVALWVRPVGRLRLRGLLVAVAIVVVLAILGGLMWLSIYGRLPVFFVQGEGGKLPRQMVVAATIAVYATTAGLLWASNRARRSAFAHWYSLSMVLMAAGLLGVMSVSVLGDPLSWASRAAQYLGGVYMLVAVLSRRESPTCKIAFVAGDKPLYRYTVAVVAVAVGTAVQMAFPKSPAIEAPFITFFPAVVLAALYGGLGPGIVATIVAGIAADYFWIEPVGSLGEYMYAGWVGMGMFLAGGTMISAVAEALHRAHAHARSELNHRAMQALPAHIAVLDKKGLIVAVNHAWTQFAQSNGAEHSPDVTAGGNYLDICRRAAADADADAQRALSGIEAVLHGTLSQFTMEYPCHSPVQQRWFYMTAVPLDEGSGGAVVTHFDITDRKQADEALRESWEQQELLFQTAADGVVMHEVISETSHGNFIQANPAICRMLGYTLEEMGELSAAGILAPGQKVLETQERERLGRDGVVIHEKMLIAKDGRQVPVELTTHVFDHGARKMAVSVIRDITERQRAQDALKAALQRFYYMFAGMYCSVLLVTEEGRVEFANQAFCDYFGFKELPADLVGMSSPELLEKIRPCYQNPDQAFQHIRQIVQSGQPVRGEELAMADGRTILRDYIPLQVDARPQGRLWIHSDITDRKRAEQARQEREALSRRQLSEIEAIYASSPIGLAVLDRRLCFVRVNERLAQMNGLPAADHIGKSLRQVVPDMAQQAQEIADRIFKTGQPVLDVEVTGADLDDPAIQRHWIEQWVPLKDEGGQAIGINVSVQDITERKRAEEALKWDDRRNALLSQTAARLLQSDNPQGIVEDLCRKVMDFLDCQTFFNFLFDEPSGRLRLNACAGIPDEEAHRIEWLDFGVAVCGCVARDGQRIIAEDIALTADSRTDLVKSYGIQAYCCHPLMVEGRLIGTLSFGTRSRPRFTADEIEVMESVSQLVASAMHRIRAQQAVLQAKEELEQRVAQRTAALVEVGQTLKAERQRLYDVLETLPAYVVLLSADHRVPFANRFFEQRFGKSNGRRCYEYLFNRSEPCEDCQSYVAMKTQKPHRWEWTGPDDRDYDVSDFPFTDTDGSLLVMEMGIDVTERKRAESALRDRTHQLRALASELTLTEQRERHRLAEVLHDGLQQLLVGAKFRLAMLDRSSDPTVRTGVAGVDELISESIQTSRSLTAELSPPILYEGGLVAALEWLGRWMQEKHALTVDLDAPDMMPGISEETTVLLFQATRELLFNVVKHAGVKSAAVRVTWSQEGVITIAVVDQGQGFDAGAIGTRARDAGGFGLFSISERIELLGGRMEIDSAPQRGSRFTLTAPATFLCPLPAPRSGQGRVSVSIPPAHRQAPDGRIRLVLVDDHIVMRQGLALLLREEPDMVIVGEASDGDSAVLLVQQVHPDVVLMDISLPGMNGIEATRAIHSQTPQVCIIGLSMFEQADQAAAMRAAGACNYLTKSGASDALAEAIRACVRK
ncbi:MAG: PAS domain S-box protein [Planctomycetaceae bacterium]|nr:PAS domain S-box protein [Planctomycetaceae bacterium]